MPRRLYQTEGLILGSKNLGEASRLIYILTPGFGLVAVMAQGVRNLSSKLRYHLQDLSWGKFTLVHGRDSWRLAGAEINALFDKMLHQDCQRQAVFVRICRLLFRLIRGEGSQRVLFYDLKAGLYFLGRGSLVRESVFHCELLLVLRLLHHLGYLERRPAFAEFLVPRLVWNQTLLIHLPPRQSAMLQAVNSALHHSQL